MSEDEITLENEQSEVVLGKRPRKKSKKLYEEFDY